MMNKKNNRHDQHRPGNGRIDLKYAPHAVLEGALERQRRDQEARAQNGPVKILWKNGKPVGDDK